MFERYGSVISRLGNLTEASDGNWSARCPAHDDRTASLSIKVAKDDGRLLITCHAGCSFQEISGALGVSPREFFIQQREGSQSGMSNTEITYDYEDAEGNLVFQAVRKEPKDFRQRRPDGNGGWLWNLSGVQRVLYHLPELKDADPRRVVFVVEGEKDVETLRANGMLATCNPGGAGKWKSSYTETLCGRNVAVLPDNDSAGLKHAYEVAESLHGAAASVRIISLPKLPDKGDATDWFRNGGSTGELQTLFKAAEPYNGISPEFLMGSEVAKNTPRTPEGQVAESIGVGDRNGVKGANRVLDGLERILEAKGMIASDPWGFVYMAYGIMEELRNGKEIKR